MINDLSGLARLFPLHTVKLGMKTPDTDDYVWAILKAMQRWRSKAKRRI